jgi:RNA polymerase sigma-70 factor (ECF subfamily)
MPRLTAVLEVAPATAPDDELVGRIARGDAAALDELFVRHRQLAYRVAYRLLGHEADALDAVQDGFVNALTHLGRFRGQSSFKTWLLKIVSNAALDIGRVRQRRDTRFVAAPTDEWPSLVEDETPPDAGLERADLRVLLANALARLPAAQRQTFVLHVDGELSYKEVAQALGISIGTVMSRLFYARQRLRSFLAEYVCP